MVSRLSLQTMLETLIELENVYFQPPDSSSMKYPAIKYSLSDIDNTFADNEVYKQQRSYELTVIDRNPDSVLVDKVSKLRTCKFDRQYKVNNLYHTVFTINY